MQTERRAQAEVNRAGVVKIGQTEALPEYWYSPVASAVKWTASITLQNFLGDHINPNDSTVHLGGGAGQAAGMPSSVLYTGQRGAALPAGTHLGAPTPNVLPLASPPC